MEVLVFELFLVWVFGCLEDETKSKEKSKKERAHPDLNRGPIDLQSIALPLSYRPKKMHRPGIEPGSFAWEAKILPLNHLRLLCVFWFRFDHFLGEGYRIERAMKSFLVEMGQNSLSK